MLFWGMRGVPDLVFEFPDGTPNATGQYQFIARTSGRVFNITWRLRTEVGPGLAFPASWVLSPQQTVRGMTSFEAAFREPENVRLTFRVTVNDMPFAFRPAPEKA